MASRDFKAALVSVTKKFIYKMSSIIHMYNYSFSWMEKLLHKTCMYLNQFEKICPLPNVELFFFFDSDYI